MLWNVIINAKCSLHFAHSEFHFRDYDFTPSKIKYYRDRTPSPDGYGSGSAFHDNYSHSFVSTAQKGVSSSRTEKTYKGGQNQKYVHFLV